MNFLPASAQPATTEHAQTGRMGFKDDDLLPCHMDLHVPPELAAKLSRLAAESDRKVDEFALDLLTRSVDHDEWFRREVEQGRSSAREGRLLDHDAVASRVSQRYSV